MTKYHIGDIITEQGINYIVTDVLSDGRARITPLREHIASKKVVTINGEPMTIADYLNQEEGRIMRAWNTVIEGTFEVPDIFKKGFHVKEDKS